MADTQKTIEILLQFKQAGEEILQAAQGSIEKLQSLTVSLGGDINSALSMPGAEQAQAKIGGVVGEVGILNVALKGTADEFKADKAAAESFSKSAVAGLNATAASAEGATAALLQTQQAAAGSSPSLVQGLNASLGRSSELGGTLRLLAGSGPILALSLAANAFEKLGKEIDDLSVKWRKGEISGSEFFEGLLLKVPVAGQISQGLLSIKDAITGVSYAEEVAAEKAKRTAEGWKEAARDIKNAAEVVQESHLQASEMIQKFDDQAALQKDSGDPVHSAIDQQIADEGSRRRDIYSRFDQRKKEIGFDTLPALRQSLGNPLINVGQIQSQIDTIEKAYKSLSEDVENELAHSQQLTDRAIAGIRKQAAAAFASEEIKKLAEDFKSNWDEAQKLVDGISRQIEAEDARLTQERSQLIKNAQTPQQKYDAGVKQLDQVQRYNPLPPGLYDQEKAKLQKTLDDELAALDKANSEKLIKQDELNAQLVTGMAREVANAQTSYDQDVANFHEALVKKEINQEQFDQLIVQRRQQMDEQLRQLSLQQHQAGEQVQLATLVANHQSTDAQLLQIQIDYERQAEQLRQEFQDQGLISEQQYNDALVALDKTTAEKRKAINGSFLDGVNQGAQEMADNVQTQAQIGDKVVHDMADGFANAFGEIVTGTKSVGGAFRDMAISILDDIAKMEAKAAFEALLSPILKGITAGIGGMFSGPGAGPLAGSPGEVSMPGGGAAFANSGGLIGRYAAGDVVGGGPWGPNIDSVLGMLTKGEFVVKRDAVWRPGVLPLLRAINSGMSVSDLGRSTAAALGSSAAAGAAPSSAASSPSGGAVIAAIPATDAHMRQLLEGGQNATIDFMKANYHRFAPRGGR
ncbi:MAG TPA: phage tail tape measure C-terminal domain-containing protein [Phycisphaerae bacterium]|nr:phage tail tape measure C-terminal domain-containing protein [Phycisphaerae bacterium]